MHVIVTAGPTREAIDSVRFITNASSGRMGYAVADAALEAGHEVMLLTGPVAIEPPVGCRVVEFVTVADLKAALERNFPNCDALVMAAAVGDFRPQSQHAGKLARSHGPVELTLLPTEDLVEAVGRQKRTDQTIVVFAVEQGEPEEIETAARAKLAAKAADYVVANGPAAIGAEKSQACILAADATVLPWATRPKHLLAKEIVSLLASNR